MNRSKLLSLATALVVAFGIFSCNSNKNDGDPAAPSSYAQRVVIEEQTGQWCGYCVYGTHEMNALVAANPGVVFGVAVHSQAYNQNGAIAGSDNYEIPWRSTYWLGFNMNGYPAGSANRGISLHPTEWPDPVNDLVGTTTDVGVEVSSVDNGNGSIDVTVKVGFGAKMRGESIIQVMVLENGIVDWQANFLAGDASAQDYAGGKYYNAPDRITDYVHDHTLRSVEPSDDGDVITEEETGVGVVVTRTYKNIPISNYGTDLTIGAIVAEDNHGEVLNCNFADLGEVAKW